MGVQASLRLKRLPTHFAPGAGRPVLVLVADVQLVLPLTLVAALRPPPAVPAEALRLLQPVDDEEVAGERPVGGVAQAALLALVGRAAAPVLGDVAVEGGQVLGGEAADGALVHVGDVPFEPLRRLRLGGPGVQSQELVSVLFFGLSFGTEGLRGGVIGQDSEENPLKPFFTFKRVRAPFSCQPEPLLDHF